MCSDAANSASADCWPCARTLLAQHISLGCDRAGTPYILLDSCTKRFVVVWELHTRMNNQPDFPFPTCFLCANARE